MIEEAVEREIYEEIGIKKEEVTFGSIVWHGEFDLIINEKSFHCKQKFIVAKTKQKNVTLTNLDGWEKQVIKKSKWVSLEEIRNSDEVIYPIILVNIFQIL